MELDLPPSDPPLESPDELQPRKSPRPTYAPFFLALGVTMLFWGLATSPVMSAGGLAILAWALWMWIRDIAQAWRN